MELWYNYLFDQSFRPSRVDTSMSSIAQIRTSITTFGNNCNAGMLRWSVDWIAVLILVFLYRGVMHHRTDGFKRMFSLHDESIKHPFTEHERVPDAAMGFIAFTLPIFSVAALSCLTKKCAIQLHRGTLGVIMTLVVTGCLTEFLKNLVGRPRPDLLERCKPDLKSWTSQPSQYNTSLVDYTICTTPFNARILQDGFKSFPSGHSSMSFAGLTYLAWYIREILSALVHKWAQQTYVEYEEAPTEEHTNDIEAGLIRQESQSPQVLATASVLAPLVPLTVATYVAVSRTMDYRHHATDVLAGSLLGFVMATIFFKLYNPAGSIRV